jgi:RNA polymerase sigma-70 factor (ECF subfamily)
MSSREPPTSATDNGVRAAGAFFVALSTSSVSPRDYSGVRDESAFEALAPARRPVRDERVSFDEFYVSELPRLVALARGLAAPAIAEDLAQEAMLAAFRRWREVSDMQRPDLWVRRTCANLAVSQFRRFLVELRATARLGARREPPPPLSEPTEEFWAAVRRLPSRQGQAAALRYVYDMPIGDIAAAMQCSQGAVKTHLSRARQALATALNADLETPR